MSEPASVVKTVEARTHGRYLVRAPATAPPWPLLVGFHGYAETAGDHLEALQTIPGNEEWLLVAVQALHRFYTRRDRVVASWMTREDRELAIADNIEYVGRVLDRMRAEYRTSGVLVFAGFSQGAAMAYRAAARHRADALIILAGDVPPDVIADHPAPLPPVLIGRGTGDDWYTEAREAADRSALARINARVDVCVFEGGHEWMDPFRAAAAGVLHAARTTGAARP
jgi:predicted esterase